MFLANPCGSEKVTDAMQSGVIGFVDTPRQGNRRPEGVTWVADNGAFSDKFVEADWWRFLVANANAADSCLFAVAPDVVADAQATLDRSRPWMPKIRALGYPVAFVAQDGLEDLAVPWDEFDVLFIGGSTEWKLGPHARVLAAQAKVRGKGLHMGRVNSERRFKYAAAIGCDTVDGTFLTFGPDTNLPKVVAWSRLNDQGDLFDLTTPEPGRDECDDGAHGYRAATMPDAPLRPTRDAAEHDELTWLHVGADECARDCAGEWAADVADSGDVVWRDA